MNYRRLIHCPDGSLKTEWLNALIFLAIADEVRVRTGFKKCWISSAAAKQTQYTRMIDMVVKGINQMLLIGIIAFSQGHNTIRTGWASCSRYTMNVTEAS